MKIYKKIQLVNKFIKYLKKKEPNLRLDISNINHKKISVHILKSDLIILIFVNLTLNILNILNIIFGAKSILII